MSTESNQTHSSIYAHRTSACSSRDLYIQQYCYFNYLTCCSTPHEIGSDWTASYWEPIDVHSGSYNQSDANVGSLHRFHLQHSNCGDSTTDSLFHCCSRVMPHTCMRWPISFSEVRWAGNGWCINEWLWLTSAEYDGEYEIATVRINL